MQSHLRLRGIVAAAAVTLGAWALAGDPSSAPLKDKLPPIPPKEPAAALKSFQTPDGFRMELVAREPQVVDPVAAAYDADGRLYVVEMRDYPHPNPPGETPAGRVRLLEDRDGDGVYETAHVFAEGLSWPTGVCCWDGGVFVTAAPDIWYFKDTTGDGKADVRRKVFTGFVVYNVQALVNGLQWGVDNRIYGVTAGNGGDIRPADRPDAEPVSVRGRDFRFDPRTLKFEAISGTAQFGNSFDDWYNRFLCANRMVAGHVVLPSRYLARNPYLPAARVVQDCAAEGANAPLTMYQVSDAEPWREVRTKRYHDEGQKLALSEMVAKGVFTSGTGITVYRGAAYPAEYRGDAFVGNVAGNLVHRRKLTPKGATFVATRADEKREFLASTDNWFRPVNFVNAPDGTLHVLDMYREVVEHPWSIPDDIKAHLDLASGRDRGRIYRLAPPGFQLPPPPRLSDAPTGELVRQLENPNAWWRETAQRLLYERQDPAAVPALKKLAEESESPLARLHALWALEGLGKLGAGEIRAALESPVPGLREHALRLAEPRLAKSPELRTLVLRLAGDPEARVRFQAALTLGEVPGEEAVERLARVARRDASDPWVRLAVLSSASGREVALLERLLLHPADGFADAGPGFTMVNALAGVIGARNQRPETDALFALAAGGKVADGVRRTLVLGLGDGLLRTGRTLQALKLDPSSPAGKLVQALLDSSARTVANEKASTAQRARAAQLLAHGRFAETRPLFEPLLDPRQPPDLQLAAVRALRNVPDREVAPLLLGGWSGYSPAVRAEVTAVLSSRPEWAAALLDAVAAKTVAPADLGPTTRATLEQHRDPEVRARARDLLRTAATTGREELIARYKEILRRPGNAERGLAVFKRECASCHYAAGVGTSVGPAIAAVGNRTPEALLTAILDPNRQIDPRYLAYTVSTLDGRILSGVITAETATTVSLRRADGASDSVLRSQIDELRSTGISLMPEGLERNIRPEEMADLLAFLASVK